MTAHPEALPHGDLTPIFPGILVATGTSKPHFMGRSWQFSRNMTVLVEGGELVLVNSVRLTDEGLARLEQLGRVRSVVRLGAFHGLDDAFYVERYGAELWSLPGLAGQHGERAQHEMVPGGRLPVAGASLFVFETAAAPEAILVLEREGGILVTCDSLQNWKTADRFFDDASREAMQGLGFLREANVGPGWRQGTGVKAEDFRRLLEVPFRHVLPAHGEPLLDRAKELYARTFEELFWRT